MEIFQTSIQAGQKVHQKILVGELANGSPIYLPLMVVRGNRPGPVLWMCGAVHGNELNGLFAMRNVYLETRPEEINGSLIFTPILNPIAFVEQKRVCFLDLLNLDEQFPGKAEGSITERIAFQVFLEIQKTANAVISFHTEAPTQNSFVYTVCRPVPGAKPEIMQKSSQMALSFGLKINRQGDKYPKNQELPIVLAGEINSICIKHGIPAFTVEVGTGGRCETANVAVAQKGIYNIMLFLGLIEGQPEMPEEQIVIPHWKFLRNNRGGLIEMLVEPGDMVPKGKIYARVMNMWEVVEELKAEEDMYVISVRTNPAVSSGDRVAIGGFEWYSVK